MTSPTDKIPEDFRLAAISALMVPGHEMVDSVARALMAERERCAKVAERYVSPPYFGAANTAASIATAIRGGS